MFTVRYLHNDGSVTVRAFNDRHHAAKFTDEALQIEPDLTAIPETADVMTAPTAVVTQWIETVGEKVYV